MMEVLLKKKQKKKKKKTEEIIWILKMVCSICGIKTMHLDNKTVRLLGYLNI